MFEHQLIEHYGNPLSFMTAEPQSATDLYYRWAGVPPRKSLTRRQRNERRWLATHLFKAAQRKEIKRVLATAESGREYIAFTALDPDAQRRHQPDGTTAGQFYRRPDGRGMGQ